MSGRGEGEGGGGAVAVQETVSEVPSEDPARDPFEPARDRLGLSILSTGYPSQLPSRADFMIANTRTWPRGPLRLGLSCPCHSH